MTSKRVKGKKGGYTNKYQFANKQLDEESDLQYFEKRYYDNRIGRFMTEDPVYWEVGITNRVEDYFTDPQQWNSYSYVRNNPINMVDPTGESAGAVAAGIGSVLGNIGSVTGPTGGGTIIGLTLTPGAQLIVVGLATTVVVGGVVYGLSSVDTKAFSQGMNPELRGDPLERVGTLAPVNIQLSTPTLPGVNVKQDAGNKLNSKSKSEVKYKEPKSGVSGKEGAKDIPSWAKGERPTTRENGKEFSERLMDQKYGKGNYSKGPRSEYQQIQKYGDRSFQNPPSIPNSSSH